MQIIVRHCVGVKLSYAKRHIKMQIVVLWHKTLRGSQVGLCYKTLRGSQVVLWHKTIHSCVSELFLCISVLLGCSGARPQLDIYFD